MITNAYEHPIKSGARRAVRQIFLCGLIAYAVAVPLGFLSERNFDAAHWNVTDPLFGSLAIAVIFAVPLWLVYRLIRFAIG